MSKPVATNDQDQGTRTSVPTTPETKVERSPASLCSFSAISSWRAAKNGDATELLIDPSRIVGFRKEQFCIYVYAILDSGKEITVPFQSCEEAAASLIC